MSALDQLWLGWVNNLTEGTDICVYVFCVWTLGYPDQLWGVWLGDSVWYPDDRRWRGGGRSYNYTTGVSITLF